MPVPSCTEFFVLGVGGFVLGVGRFSRCMNACHSPAMRMQFVQRSGLSLV
jgi:hypothetical protein